MNRKIVAAIAFLTVIALLFSRAGIWRLSPSPGNAPEEPEVEETEAEENERETSEPEEGEDAEPAPEQETFTFESITFDVSVVAENLEVPWEILPLPDEDDWLITQRGGLVTSLQHGDLIIIDEATHAGEGGLLGMELHPEFEENRSIYFYYTTRESTGPVNRIVRYQYENQTFSDETLILDNIPGHQIHNGGRIAFGPDGYLYATTGDAAEVHLSQQRDSLAGKILRMTDEGGIPADNPFEDSYIYSYGHRNPQGLAWHPDTEALYSSEHGPTRMDEVNIILPGKNYGWPEVTCDAAPTEYEDAVSCYSDFTLAPSGMDFLDIEGLEGSHLLVTGLRGNQIRHLSLDEEGMPIEEQALFTDYGRIRTVRFHEGSLYFITNNRDGRGNPAPDDDRMFRVDLIVE